MSDYIKRADAVDAIEQIRYALWEIDIPSPTVPEYIEHHESVQEVMKFLNEKLEEIKNAPYADVRENVKGKWAEKKVIHKDEATEMIEEWQSCRCSVCGRYDTRPYLYNFSEPNFCSFCGADMRGEEDGER